MAMKKFTEALEALMREHGMELSATPEITLNRPRQEAFISHDMSVDAFRATRERQPFDLQITAKASVAGAWHHDSGDDRMLHPDLRSNVQIEGQPASGLSLSNAELGTGE